ncbi:MAG: hypothetical protein OHK0057_33000 [Thermoflexibacter sp.]
MKTLNLIFVFTLLWGITAFAQDDEKRQETLFGRGTSVSGFGGPIVEFSMAKGQFSVSNGGGGAVIFNQSFFIGGYGVNTSNRLAINVPNANYRLDFGHGGFWLGYINSHTKLVHFASSLRLGWGSVNMRDSRNYGSNLNTRLSNCFVATPELGFEVNFTRFFRIAATVGYRIVAGISEINFTDIQGGVVEKVNNADFSSPMGSLTFKFGWFGR